jgi:hypothetical protein
MGIRVARRSTGRDRLRAVAAAVISLLATSSLLFGMTVTAANAKPADLTANVAPVEDQPPSEAEKASGFVAPVSQPSELVRGGVNAPPAALVITGLILFVAGSALLLLRRRQPYD